MSKEFLLETLGIRDTRLIPEALMEVLFGDPANRHKFYRAMLEANDFAMDREWFQPIYEAELSERGQKKQDFTPAAASQLAAMITDNGARRQGILEPTADIALFNRLVFLTFSKTTFSDQEKRNYENLKLIEKRGLTHLTNQLLQLRSKFQTDFRRVWDETLSDMNDRVRSYNVEDRTLRNWAILLAAYRALRTDIDVPFDSEEIFKLCCKGCVDQNQKTKQNNELSGFWEIVENLVASGQAYINIDYKLCAGDRPFAIKESDVPFEPKHGVRYIYLAFQRLSALYMKEGKDVNGKVIPRDSLKYYLEHSPEFIGTAKSMRFKLLENKTYVSSNPETGKSRVTTAMVFDYDALKVNYGIDLDISTDTLEIGDNRTAASAPPSVTEPAEAVDAELWEE